MTPVAAITAAGDDGGAPCSRRWTTRCCRREPPTSATWRRGSRATSSELRRRASSAASIAVAEDLAPSITVELDRTHLAGIALEGGSRTSHAAILARALGIPAVVGVAGLVARAQEADGARASTETRASAVLDPDAAARERAWSVPRATRRVDARRTPPSRARPLATADGHRVRLRREHRRAGRGGAAFESGAEGIGLFRTEFAFAGRASGAADSRRSRPRPTRAVLRAAGGRPGGRAPGRHRGGQAAAIHRRSRRRRTRSSACVPSASRMRHPASVRDPDPRDPASPRGPRAAPSRSWRRWSPMSRTPELVRALVDEARVAVPGCTSAAHRHHGGGPGGGPGCRPARRRTWTS